MVTPVAYLDRREVSAGKQPICIKSLVSVSSENHVNDDCEITTHCLRKKYSFVGVYKFLDEVLDSVDSFDLAKSVLVRIRSINVFLKEFGFLCKSDMIRLSECHRIHVPQPCFKKTVLSLLQSHNCDSECAELIYVFDLLVFERQCPDFTSESRTRGKGKSTIRVKRPSLSEYESQIDDENEISFRRLNQHFGFVDVYQTMDELLHENEYFDEGFHVVKFDTVRQLVEISALCLSIC